MDNKEEWFEIPFISHYGKGHLQGGHSGRYPWGSGDKSYQRSKNFLDRITQLKSKGWKETDANIQKEFGMTKSEYSKMKSISKNEEQLYNISRIKKLYEEGYNRSEIARKMGKNESTIRGYELQDEKAKVYQLKETVDFIRDRLKKHKMIDVGSGVENDLGITRKRLDSALYILQDEGYKLYGGRIPQMTDKNKQITQKVLCDKNCKPGDIYDFSKVHSIRDYVSTDGGDSYQKRFTYPKSMDSKRLMIRYAEDGGESKDGLIELRRGVPDLSLSGAKYSQVRILVDGTHYIKGMAVYSDNMPKGVDVVFNTNKDKSKSMKEVLKEIKPDPTNPFGSAIKGADQGGQYWYTDKNGKKQLGLINKRADEGDWNDWKNSIPSQFLSKQSISLAKQQLDIAKDNKFKEYSDILKLNNPVVKKYYLNKFAEDCDAAAVDLKAASLPGQRYHVILPNNTLKDTEVYAPSYQNGTKLALIRYPHGGVFEIPILTVNNKNKLGQEIIGTKSVDAICLNKKVADRLSGADYDGDAVMAIPTHDAQGKVKIKNKPMEEYPGLIGFDNKLEYGTKKVINSKGEAEYYRGDRKVKIMTDTNAKMGQISNLITDMSLQGANNADIAKAVRHSMVVIDAEKHKLDYQQSYIDNDIERLKKLYQPKFNKDGEVIGGGRCIFSNL